MAVKTVSAFRTDLMQEFGLAEDNDNEGTSADAILSYISEANELFINHRAWKFRLKSKTQFIYPDTRVKTLFTVSGPTIELVKTDDWGNTGRVMIDLDIIEFTANNTATDVLTPTLSDIDRTHETGEKAYLLYEVPADYNKVASLWVDGVEHYREDERTKKFPSYRRFWEIEVKLSNGVVKKYFVFPYHSTTRKIFFWYAQKATDYTVTPLDLTITYIEVPSPYWNYIKHVVKERIYIHLEELALADKHAMKAAEILKQAAILDSKQHFGTQTPLRTEWDNPAIRLYGSNRYPFNPNNQE